jgi:hypothetical protein
MSSIRISAFHNIIKNKKVTDSVGGSEKRILKTFAVVVVGNVCLCPFA